MQGRFCQLGTTVPVSGKTAVAHTGGIKLQCFMVASLSIVSICSVLCVIILVTTMVLLLYCVH